MSSTELTEPQQDDAELAFKLHREVVEALAAGRKALWRAAEALYAFDEARGWAALGYDGRNAWLADPEIGMNHGTYFRLVNTWRELVAVRQIEPERLLQLDQAKVAIVTKAIKDGKKADGTRVTVDEALSDAENLGARDLRREYYGTQDEDQSNVELNADTSDSDTSGRVLDDTPEPMRADEIVGVIEVDGHAFAEAIVEHGLSMSEDELAAHDAAVAGDVVEVPTPDGVEVYEVLRGEVLDPEPVYEYPGWVTPGVVQGAYNELHEGVECGASFPRISHRATEVARELAKAWLATNQK